MTIISFLVNVKIVRNVLVGYENILSDLRLFLYYKKMTKKRDMKFYWRSTNIFHPGSWHMTLSTFVETSSRIPYALNLHKGELITIVDRGSKRSL